MLAGLVDVLAHRIAVEDRRRARTDSASCRDWRWIVLVGAEAGDDRLGAAGEPGEVVVVDVAGADAQVGLEIRPEDGERRAPTRRSRRDAVVGVEIEQRARRSRRPRARRARACSSRVCGAVAAEREEDRDALGGIACELVEQRGQEACAIGQGRVTSLTTMAADGGALRELGRRGAPIGSARARRISACSSAGVGRAAAASGR